MIGCKFNRRKQTHTQTHTNTQLYYHLGEEDNQFDFHYTNLVPFNFNSDDFVCYILDRFKSIYLAQYIRFT